MKKLLNVFLILGITLFLSSCEKDNTADWERDRDNLIGAWSGTADFVKTFEDGSQESGQRIVGIEFIDNENAVMNIGFFGSFMNWYYQPDPTRIVLTSPTGYTISGSPSVFEVTINGGNTHRWKTEFIEFDYNPTTMVSKNIQVAETWNVTKK